LKNCDKFYSSKEKRKLDVETPLYKAKIVVPFFGLATIFLLF